jgi:Ca-activated chloride channel homolog
VRFLRLLFLATLLLAIAGGSVEAQQNPAPPAPASQSPAPQNPVPPDRVMGQQPPIPPIQVVTGLVHLVATVTDRRRNFVTNLDRKDFRVLEDGKPQDIRFFGRESDLPLRIGLLLDTSNSIRPRLQFEKDAAIDFLNNVIRRDKDLAFVVTFDNEPEVIQNYTGDLAQLTTMIRKQKAGGVTSLNDAVYLAAEKLSNPPLPSGSNPEVRRVLVVISDGDDNTSDHALSDAIESAIRAEAAIYAISTNSEWLSSDATGPHFMRMQQGDKVLEKFANESGGRVFFPYRIEDLAQSFVDIGTELRSQYFIAYTPASAPVNGQYRKIEIQTDRKGLIVRARKGYYATPGLVPSPSTK